MMTRLFVSGKPGVRIRTCGAKGGDRNSVFAGMLAEYTTSVHLGDGGRTEDVHGDLVSGTYFETLGLQPALGRLFTREDDRVAGAHPLVVLGHGFWTRHFGADPGVV